MKLRTRWPQHISSPSLSDHKKLFIMKFLVSLLMVVLATPALTQFHSNQDFPIYDKTQRPIHLISRQFRSQDILGNYKFGFESTDGVQKEEVRKLNGDVAGGYFYTSPEGERIQISYESGPGGFRPTGNAIPQPPALPEANVRAIQSHLAALEEARKRAPDEEYDEQGRLISPRRYAPAPNFRQDFRDY